ncbi:MAG TPA: hypothetical protein VNJ01_02690 [Bacteriovoracaceae bacterium]|nr:hypothetical protein [Bacteriovoracaceae bacterium]
MNPLENLLNQARSGKLGHFYVVESGGHQLAATQALTAFVHSFIKTYYQKIEGQKSTISHLMDHPDVMVLGNLKSETQDDQDVETKAFSVLEAEQFARFFEFRPVQSKRKFAVITQAHRLPAVVANKWLKLLEEPTGEATIFLLNPRRQKLLDTLHSRAIHLRLPQEIQQHDKSDWEGLLENVKTTPLSQFLETYSRGPKELSFWVNELITWEASQLDHLTPKSDLLDWVKYFQLMETFHQPTATKWTLFYSYLKDHVLSRQDH